MKYFILIIALNKNVSFLSFSADFCSSGSRDGRDFSWIEGGVSLILFSFSGKVAWV